MDVRVQRKWFTEKSTCGELYIDDAFLCFTLEDRIRRAGFKVKRETAIPPGRYDLVIDWSNRFQRLMPHVLYVPMFEGIRIHAGNTHADTEGCLLVGTARDVDKVLHSRNAYALLFPKLVEACKREKVTITYENVEPPEGLLK